MKELIAQGSGLDDMYHMGDYEPMFEEYDTGEVRVFLPGPISAQEVMAIQDSIISQGVVLTKPITQSGSQLTISFRKELAPLAIIGFAVAGVVVLVIGWQILKTIAAISPFFWIAGGAVLIYWMSKKGTVKSYATQRVK